MLDNIVTARKLLTFLLTVRDRVVVQFLLAVHFEVAEVVIVLAISVHLQVVILVLRLADIVLIVVNYDPSVVPDDQGLVCEGELANGEGKIIFVENVFDLVV